MEGTVPWSLHRKWNFRAGMVDGGEGTGGGFRDIGGEVFFPCLTKSSARDVTERRCWEGVVRLGMYSEQSIPPCIAQPAPHWADFQTGSTSCIRTSDDSSCTSVMLLFLQRVMQTTFV